MLAEDYVCRNYLKIAAIVREEIERNRIVLVSGDQLLRQVIRLMNRDYRNEADPEVSMRKAIDRLVRYHKKEEEEI